MKLLFLILLTVWTIKISAAEEVSALLNKLKSADKAEREVAAKKLSAINSPLSKSIKEEVQFLIGLQKDESPLVRAYAATALGDLMNTLLPANIQAMSDKSPEVIDAMQKVAQRGREATGLGKDPITVNESRATASCRAYAEAQEIYRRSDHDKDGVLEFAQSLRGDNSLSEHKAGQNDLGLIDRVFAQAENGPSDNTMPKEGYYFKVLTKQGVSATGGVRNYVKDGNMILGFALLAYPAEYRKTGRNCFLINNNGTIFQKDLGKDTLELAKKLTEFNPDTTWFAAE
jgi:hypothetical protein